VSVQINVTMLFHSSVCVIHMKVEGEEIRRRLPRLVTNVIMAIIFWLVSVFVPPTLEGLTVPGINTQASLLVWILTILVLGIFLIRALSDAMVLGDVLTDALVRKLGVKEERSPKRAAREFAYIIIIVLVVTAVSPLLANIQDVGFYLSTATVYIGLGLIILFLYDIGRIIYKIIEDKADSFADYFAQIKQKNKSSE
jgi:uncharacterized RDD family membrane protein YckC